MKKLLLYLSILTISGCGSSFNHSSLSKNCPVKPDRTLRKEAIDFTTLKDQKIRRSGKVRKGEYIGYTFNAKSSQKLKYSTEENLCIWVYAPNNQLLDITEPLPIDGEYTIQVSVAQGLTTFDLDLSLDSPKLSPQSSATSPSKTPPQPSTTSPSKTPPQPSTTSPSKTPSQSSTTSPSKTPPQPSTESVSANKENQIFLPIVINIFSDLILVLCGYFGVKSIKDYVRDYEAVQEIGDLTSFWTISEKSRKLKEEKYKIVFCVHCDRNQTGNNNMNDFLFSYHYSCAIHMIRNVLHQIHGKDVVTLHPVKKGEQLKKEFFNENIIILGGYQGIEGVNLFCEKLKLELPLGNPLVSTKNNKNFDVVKRARGSIVRIVNVNVNKLIILLDGEHDLGMLGSVKIVTAPMKTYRKNDITINVRDTFVRASKKETNYQLDLEITNECGQDILEPELVSIRLAQDKDTSLILKREEIQDAINSISS
jgi:hypothetical protein